MVEFIKNICNWFVENKDAVIVVLTSSQFVAVVTTVIGLFKQRLDIKLNNATITNLKASLQDANDTLTSLKGIEQLTSVNERIDNLKKDTLDALDVMNVKLEAIVEVQAIVYSTIKDETMRKNITNVYNKAKFAESKTREELTKTITELKKQLEDKMNDVKEVIENVESVAENVNSKVNTVSRY